MKRDELMFGTGVLVALVVNALFTLWQPPWWTALITFPVGVWWAVSIILAWRTELRRPKPQLRRQHWEEQL
jgi:Sec-independent protein secretion pathway component TatC